MSQPIAAVNPQTGASCIEIVPSLPIYPTSDTYIFHFFEDGPIEANTAEEAEDMLSPEFLAEHMSTINEDGEMVPVEGAEYRIVEVEY